MIRKMKEALAWRGPNGRVMGHIVLLRRDAEALVEDYEQLVAAYLLTPLPTLCTHGPEPERKRHWILKFEDADKEDMHFDDEAEAMKMFVLHTIQWNCTLFVTAEFKPIKITFTTKAMESKCD